MKAKAVRRVAISVIESLTLIILTCMVVQTLLTVLGRNVGFTVPNTTEITAFWYLPLAAFLGIVVAKSRGQHIEANLFYDRFSPATQRFVEVIYLVLAVVTVAGMAYFGWKEAIRALEIGQTALVSNVPVSVPMMISAACLIVLVMQYGTDLVKVFVSSEGASQNDDSKTSEKHAVEDPTLTGTRESSMRTDE